MAETARVFKVSNNKFKFGTKGLESADADMMMPKDLTNFAPTIDNTTDEWYAMDAEGWAKSAVVGKKLSFSFQGKRSVGDPGNDYIASLFMAMGSDAMTKLQFLEALTKCSDYYQICSDDIFLVAPSPVFKAVP